MIGIFIFMILVLNDIFILDWSYFVVLWDGFGREKNFSEIDLVGVYSFRDFLVDFERVYFQTFGGEKVEVFL